LKTKMSDAGNLEDAIPIKKTSNAVYIGGGVALVAIVGLVLSMSGGKEAAIEKAQETENAASAAKGMTKAEAEERAAHIQKTQAALQAADAEETADAQQKRASEEAKRREAQAQAAPSPAPSQGASSSPAAPAPKKPAVNKKSLDGLGDDITSALK
jgi:hypothetical protein